MEVQENRFSYGVIEAELDKEGGGELFDYEAIDGGEIDNGDIQLVESWNVLLSQTIRGIYDGDEFTNRFDKVNNDRNKYFQRWKTREEIDGAEGFVEEESSRC